MNTVLVTGGAGFIGGHLVKELVAAECKVVVIDNFSNNNERTMRELELDGHINKDVFVHRQDIRNRDAVSDIFKHKTIDTCVHLASKISVQDSIIRPLETIDVNVIGTLNVLEACSDNDVDNFVFASSAAVYGHPKELPLSEANVTQPLSPYGASKVASEALVSSFSSRLKNTQVLRFFNVYGYGQTSTYAGVITKFAERLSNRLPPVIYGQGNQSRDFIHVNDVIRAIILSFEIKNDASNWMDYPKILNIGTGRPTTILDLAILMIDIFGLKGKIEPLYSDARTGDILHSYPDITRAKELIGFSAKEDLKSGLMELLKL